MLGFLEALWRDWPARMTGPLSLILLFTPIIAPQFTARRLGGSTLLWLVAFICMLVSAYRTWLFEHRVRIAEKLDPLIEDGRLVRQLWDRIQYDYRESAFIRFPLGGFEVKEWEEIHKQLLRLFFWTNLQAQRVQWRFEQLGITEQPRLSAVMSNQSLRESINALDYTKLLEEHAAMLTQLRQQLAGVTGTSSRA